MCISQKGLSSKTETSFPCHSPFLYPFLENHHGLQVLRFLRQVCLEVRRVMCEILSRSWSNRVDCGSQLPGLKATLHGPDPQCARRPWGRWECVCASVWLLQALWALRASSHDYFSKSNFSFFQIREVFWRQILFQKSRILHLRKHSTCEGTFPSWGTVNIDPNQ